MKRNIPSCVEILSHTLMFTLVGCVNSSSLIGRGLGYRVTKIKDESPMSSTAANFAFRHEPGTAIECLSVGPTMGKTILCTKPEFL